MKWMKSSTSKTCELCKHKITTVQNLKPISKWERANGTGIECSNLLAESCGLIIIAFLGTIIMLGWVQSKKDSLLLPASVLCVVLLILGMIMLMLVCAMCFDGIAIFKKWKAQNTMVVVQEIAQV